MSKITLNPTSIRNLTGVHPSLVAVVKRGLELSDVPFTVTEGRRTAKVHKELIAAGAQHASRNHALTGLAVQLAPIIAGQLRNDWPLFSKIAKGIKAAARELGVTVTWGGDAHALKNGAHFELSSDDAT